MGSESRDQFKDIVFEMRYVIQTELSRRKVREINKLSGFLVLYFDDRMCWNYTEHTDFMSMFSTVIHKNLILADMEKLQHLKSCLGGPALDAVGASEVTDANYPAALELLDKSYNNKRLIFESHISAII